jgi:hypothetical protein
MHLSCLAWDNSNNHVPMSYEYRCAPGVRVLEGHATRATGVLVAVMGIAPPPGRVGRWELVVLSASQSYFVRELVVPFAL